MIPTNNKTSGKENQIANAETIIVDVPKPVIVPKNAAMNVRKRIKKNSMLYKVYLYETRFLSIKLFGFVCDSVTIYLSYANNFYR